MLGLIGWSMLATVVVFFVLYFASQASASIVDWAQNKAINKRKKRNPTVVVDNES